MARKTHSITSAQIRAGRALLRMRQADLAARSGVPINSIKRFESKDDISGARYDSIEAIRAVLEEEGVVFVPNGVTLPTRQG